MDIKAFLKSLFPEKAADIDKLDGGNPPAPAPAPAPQPQIDISALVHNRSALETLVAAQQKSEQEKAELKAKLEEQAKAIEAFQAEKAATQAQIEKQAAEARKAEIAKLIADAQQDGRIEAKNEDKVKLYQQLLESNYDTGKALIESLPKNPAITKQTAPPQQQANDNGHNAGKALSLNEIRSQAASAIKSAIYN